MEDKAYLEAVENLSLIRGVLERTRKSFAAFSRIFIYWGLLFLVNAIGVSFLVSYSANAGNAGQLYPIFQYVLPLARIAIAVIIYLFIVRRIPLVGLEKYLMIVWILVITMNMLPPRINLVTSTPLPDMAYVAIQYSTLPIELFSLAIALIATGMFTDFKTLKYVGIAYIALSATFSYLPIPIFDSLFHLFVLPITLLYLGFFLRSQPRIAGV